MTVSSLHKKGARSAYASGGPTFRQIEPISQGLDNARRLRELVTELKDLTIQSSSAPKMGELKRFGMCGKRAICLEVSENLTDRQRESRGSIAKSTRASTTTTCSGGPSASVCR